MKKYLITMRKIEKIYSKEKNEFSQAKKFVIEEK